MTLGIIDRLDECVGIVPDDPGEIVRHARPLTDEDRAKIREQMIERMIRQGRS